MNNVKTNWLGRPILKDSDSGQLENSSALNEFDKGLPRQDAEAKAYEDYIREHREKAAAHHLAGARTAAAAGDNEAALKHHLLWTMHAKALGHPEVGQIPDSVKAHMDGDHKPNLYRFKPHAADMFSLQEQGLVKSEAPLHATVSGFMGGLKALAPKTPERGRFITQHMNHPPFLAALKAHPQGAQLHQQLTAYMNSPANAGFRPGAAKVMVKSEIEKELELVQELKKEVIQFPGNPTPTHRYRANAEVKDARQEFWDRRMEGHAERQLEPKSASVSGIGLENRDIFDYSHHLPQDMRAQGYTLSIHAPAKHSDNSLPYVYSELSHNGNPIASVGSNISMSENSAQTSKPYVRVPGHQIPEAAMVAAINEHMPHIQHAAGKEMQRLASMDPVSASSVLASNPHNAFNKPAANTNPDPARGQLVPFPPTKKSEIERELELVQGLRKNETKRKSVAEMGRTPGRK